MNRVKKRLLYLAIGEFAALCTFILLCVSLNLTSNLGNLQASATGAQLLSKQSIAFEVKKCIPEPLTIGSREVK